MFLDQYYNEADDYLSTVNSWTDPNPAPVIYYHNGFHVVRDDYLTYGSKIRFLDHYVKTSSYSELVYGSSPAQGYGQISLGYLCKLYGKKAVIFMAERSTGKLHLYQERAIGLGVDIRWVKMGMLTVTEKRAKDYVKEDPKNRTLLPMGLCHPTSMGSIIKVARSLSIVPDHVWVAAGSGTLARGLSYAWPNAEIHAVSVGHKLSDEELGRCTLHLTNYKFQQDCKESERPPYPSVPNYDAKVWKVAHENADLSKLNLIWNVGA